MYSLGLKHNEPNCEKSCHAEGFGSCCVVHSVLYCLPGFCAWESFGCSVDMWILMSPNWTQRPRNFWGTEE